MNELLVEQPSSTEAPGRESLPPGPRSPSLVQTLRFWSARDRYLTQCRERYGNIFTLDVAPSGTLVYLADPTDIKAVYTGDRDVFLAGQGNSILAPVMGTSSVLITDGEQHLRQRKRMLPAFHGESVRNYEQTIVEVTERELRGWPIGEPFALHPRMQAVTLEVIMRAVIGVREADRLAVLRPLLRAIAEISPVVMLMWVRPELRHVGPWRRYVRTLERVDRLLLEEIRRRRKAPDLAERRDVLSLLMDPSTEQDPMSDRELRDQLVTLLLAGHETTATGLAWAFERLLRDPVRLRRLTDEVEAGEEQYLDAVVKEILRARPVIFDTARVLKVPVEIRGWTLPAGVTVMPSIGLVHLDGQRYQDPQAFKPERFMEDEVAGYGWIPFGGGVRRCLGAAFATLEMKVVLRTVLTQVELRAPDPRDERMVGRHITLVPSRGARVVARSRTRRPMSG